MSIDLAALSQARRLVLVEGQSDKAAVEVLAQRRGHAVGGTGL